MDSKRDALAHDIVAAAQGTVRRGLNHGMTGNVSARFGQGCLITASAVGFEDIGVDDIVAIDLAGVLLDEGTAHVPSSEWRIHTAVYDQRPEVGAVIHCHPIHATALSCLREGIPPFHYMVAAVGAGDIRCSGYATFGTQELSEAMLDALDGRAACLLANHGIVACGADVGGALDMATTVEVLAHTYLTARGVGTPVLLSDDEVDTLVNRFARYAPGRRL